MKYEPHKLISATHYVSSSKSITRVELVEAHKSVHPYQIWHYNDFDFKNPDKKVGYRFYQTSLKISAEKVLLELRDQLIIKEKMSLFDENSQKTSFFHNIFKIFKPKVKELPLVQKENEVASEINYISEFKNSKIKAIFELAYILEHAFNTADENLKNKLIRRIADPVFRILQNLQRVKSTEISPEILQNLETLKVYAEKMISDHGRDENNKFLTDAEIISKVAIQIIKNEEIYS